MRNTPECTCYANYYGNVVLCPFHSAADDMYKALVTIRDRYVTLSIEMPDILVIMASKAITRAEGK